MTDRRLNRDAEPFCRDFLPGSLDDPEDVDLPAEAFRWTRRQADGGTDRLSRPFERGSLVAIDRAPLSLIDAARD